MYAPFPPILQYLLETTIYAEQSSGFANDPINTNPYPYDQWLILDSPLGPSRSIVVADPKLAVY